MTEQRCGRAKTEAFKLLLARGWKWTTDEGWLAPQGTHQQALGAVSDEVSAVAPGAAERPQEVLRATNLPSVAPVEQERQEWPRETYENCLRYSGLLLTPAQVAGISLLTRDLIDKWREQSASPAVVSEPPREEEEA